jgi:creatinine amidohydrolase
MVQTRNPSFACLALCALLTATPTAAAAPSVLLEQLAWTELREAIAAGTTTIIVPVGGTEQNGPHMALGKHNVRALLLSKRIAEALGNAIVAPVIAYVPEGGIDPPTAHMRYPGTITVPSPVFAGLVEAAGRSFRQSGFRDIVFLGDHGGYQKDLKAVAARLNREWSGTPARAHAIDIYYGVTESAYPAALRSRGLRDDEIGTHAALADTSLTLAVAPDLVRKDLLASPAARNANGVRGDPSRSTAELGALGVDLIVARTTDAIRIAVRR